jgi:hypothetical protein
MRFHIAYETRLPAVAEIDAPTAKDAAIIFFMRNPCEKDDHILVHHILASGEAQCDRFYTGDLAKDDLLAQSKPTPPQPNPSVLQPAHLSPESASPLPQSPHPTSQLASPLPQPVRQIPQPTRTQLTSAQIFVGVLVILGIWYCSQNENAPRSLQPKPYVLYTPEGKKELTQKEYDDLMIKEAKDRQELGQKLQDAAQKLKDDLRGIYGHLLQVHNVL